MGWQKSAVMVPNLFFLALDRSQKPYYCESKNPHVRAVLTTALLGLAPARSTLASAANHGKSISACRRDDLGVANGNATSKVKDHSVRSIPAPAESKEKHTSQPLSGPSN